MKRAQLSALLISAVALSLGACSKQEAVTLTESPAPGAPVAVSGSDDLSAETAAYQAWVEGQIDGLLGETQKFVTALNAGQVDEAKRLYAPTRMYFERSEPVAESFGDLDPRIDNREADLEKDEKWTGFHPIEKILWLEHTTKGTEKLSVQLLNDIKELRAKIPTAEVTGELMVQGAVDLLNEVSTSKISGEEEIYSHTDLFDFKANIEGAEKIFDIFKPKLEAKSPALVATLTDKFAAVNALLETHRMGDGFKLYTQLKPSDTKALAEAVNKLGEPLAQMGVILQ